MILSNPDFALVQRAVDALVDKIASLHLSLVVESDFDKLVRFLRSLEGAFVYPTFDPDRNRFANGFWLRVIDEDGRTLACHAQRLFETEDFCDLLSSGRLWYEDGLPAGTLPLDVLTLSRRIAGRVAHAGSLWVDPSVRSKGLAVYLPYLSRATCMRNFEVDFYTALVFKKMADSDVPRHSYGYPSIEPCMRGFFPPTGREEDVYVCFMSAQEAVDLIRGLPRHARFPVEIKPTLNGEIGEFAFVDADHQLVDPTAVVSQG